MNTACEEFEKEKRIQIPEHFSKNPGLISRLKRTTRLFDTLPEPFHMATDFIFRYVEKYSYQAKCNRKCRKYSDKDILARVLFLQTHRTRDLKLHGINYSTVYERILRWNKQSVLQSAILYCH